MAEDLREATLRYHLEPKPDDKIEVVSPKPLGNQRDLALAYMLGTARSVHILPPSGTACGILNVIAVAAVGAQHQTTSTPRML